MNKYEEVINSCSNLVYAIINKYFKGYSCEDLYQVGVIGIMKAYNNYKNDKNVKFSTYAYKYIYGEIYAYINNNKLIKVNKENILLLKKIKQAKDILMQKLMREVSIKDLVSYLGIDESIIIAALNSSYTVDSLDRKIISSDNDLLLLDTIKDNRDYFNIDYLLLEDEVSKLSKEDQEIIYLRYFKGLSQSEVASILNKNQVGISRCEAKTLKKIRQNYICAT